MVNFDFEGPNTSYVLYVDNVGTSGISAVGSVSGNSLPIYNAGTSDQINIPQINTTFTIQDPAFTNTDQQALNSKMIWGGNALRYGIPDDTYLYGYFQLFKRTTTNPSDPEVDAEPTTGNMQANLLYCNLHGCGFGAGYGPSATRGGTTDPNHTLSYNGTFGNQAGTSGTDADGTIYTTNMNFNMHGSGAIINTGGFGFGWQHNLNTAAGSDYLVLNVNTPASAFSLQAVIIDALGNVSIPSIKAATGTRYVCVDTSGKLISQATACSGT
jgi:hypothetical protein